MSHEDTQGRKLRSSHFYKAQYFAGGIRVSVEVLLTLANPDDIVILSPCSSESCRESRSTRFGSPTF